MTPRQADELTERLRGIIGKMLGHSFQGGADPDSASAAGVSRAQSF
jgi:hypothetical protein